MRSEDKSHEASASNWAGETVGIVGGAAFGAYLQGPAGAIAGAATGAALGEVWKTALGDMARRALGRGEARRVNSLVNSAEMAMRAEIDWGRRFRDDHFFEEELGDRPAVEEVFEGIMLAAQREHEEKKLVLMGRMLARFAFESNLSRAYCNLLIRTVERLSYRQLCLLSLFHIGNRDSYGMRNDVKAAPWHLPPSSPLPGLLQEILELHRETLVQQSAADHSGHDIMLNIFLIAPGRTHVVTGIGGWLCELMDLETAILANERENIAALLR